MIRNFMAFLGFLVSLGLLVSCPVSPIGTGNGDDDGGPTNDTTPPSVSIISPVADAVVPPSLTVKIDASDSSGIQRVVVTDNESQTNELTSKTGSYYETLIALSSNGPHSVTVWACDNCSNTSSPVSVTVTADSTLPAVVITHPVDGSATNVAAFNANGTASVDLPATITLVETGIDGSNYSAASGTAPWTQSLSGLAEGTYTLTARAVSSGDRTNSATSSFTVDLTRPSSSISGTSGLTNRDSNYTVSGTAFDALSGTTNVYVQLDSDSFVSVPVTGGNWTATLTVTNGNHTCRVFTRDLAGNCSDTNQITWTYVEPAEWAVLVHMAVDNNIDYDFDRLNLIVSNYLATLESVEAADTAGKVEILVMMDCYNTDINGNGYATRYRDGYYRLRGGVFSNDLVVPKSEINSGSLAETTAFFNWAVSNYPGKRYVYSVFNHGSGFDDANESGTYGGIGILGIGFDDNSSDSLSHRELGQALSYLKGKIGKNISLFFPYACLMGGMELAYEIRDSVDRMLFSEELYPAEKWSYEALRTLTTNASISAEDLGKAFCDSAHTYFTTVVARTFTLSLIRLDAVSALASALSDYAQSALTYMGSLPDRAAVFNRVALDSFSMYSVYGIQNFYYMDIGDYMNGIISTNVSSTVQTMAAAVNTALQNCVVYNRQSGYPDASGMTILHNIWYSPYQYSIPLYKSILAFGANKWADYVAAVGNLKPVISADAYEPDNAAFAQAKPITVGAAAQQRTLHVSNDVDYISVSLTAGQTYKVETYARTTDPDTVIALFNASSNMLAYDDDSGPGYYSLFYYTPSTTGTYYIGVASAVGQVGDYLIDVTVSAGPTGDSYEPDNDLASARDITLNAAYQTRTVYPAGDNDYMRLDLSSVIPGTQIKIETYQDGASCDTYVHLLDSVGTQIAFDDDGGADLYSRLVFTCNTPGIYYVRARLYSPSTTGGYRIDAVSGSFGTEPIGFDPPKETPETKQATLLDFLNYHK